MNKGKEKKNEKANPGFCCLALRERRNSRGQPDRILPASGYLCALSPSAGK
jgi:hypothetical protein